MFLPARERGEVAPSYGDGGVMNHTDSAAPDPSASPGPLSGFVRKENGFARLGR
jgi:hypothetical protein